MEVREKFEKMCRESWNKLVRAEHTLGISSEEANIFRSTWSELDRAYQLVYRERIEYLNIRSNPRYELEDYCRVCFKEMKSAENEYGKDSPEARILREKWNAYDTAYRITYSCRIYYKA